MTKEINKNLENQLTKAESALNSDKPAWKIMDNLADYLYNSGYDTEADKAFADVGLSFVDDINDDADDYDKADLDKANSAYGDYVDDETFSDVIPQQVTNFISILTDYIKA